MEKSKKTVLLTGGLGLLGKAIACDLDKQGFHVIVVDTHNLAEGLNHNIDYIQFDLCKIDEYPHLIEEIENKTHNLKCLINNAAYNPRAEDEHSASGRFEDIQLEGWQNEFLINLTAPVFLIKEMLPLFNQAGGAQCKIINMLSTYGVVPPNQNIYKSLSKNRGKEFVKPLSYSAI
jgi:NAD(P)-dependent dehydrogenase (short-subunit alcohol dehydrogenase family)